MFGATCRGPRVGARIAWVALALACDASGTIVGGVDAAPAPSDAAAPDSASDDAGIEARVDALLSRMTIDEKIGQMTIAGIGSIASLDDVTTYALGGLGGAPENLDPASWLALTGDIRARAAATRLGIPPIIAIDAVHGNAKVHGATVFPQNIGLGCAGDPDLVRRVEAATAEELSALGFTTAWAPDVDVGRDIRWGRTYETFAEDPALVSPMARAGVEGFAQRGVIGCAKHALGSGGTLWGSGFAGGIDRGDVEIEEAEMRRVHLPPFQAAIEAGAPMIMVSYCAWHGMRMSTSTYWLDAVIKGELGFDGILVSDGDALSTLGGTMLDDARVAIEGGLDMFIVTAQYAVFIAAVKALVDDGTVSVARIDESVRRILRVKMRAGLFGAPAPDPAGIATVGSAAHRTLAREAVQKSLVLLKNDGMLPLPKTAHVRLAGRGANDMGIQSGGWTLRWQGVTGMDAAAFGGGTTILDGFRGAIAPPGSVTYSADGSGAAGADVAVVVLHELPYAEFMGDVSDPYIGKPGRPNVYERSNATVIANATAANVPLVLVLVTGRPVRIEWLLPSFRAVVAAWLPGSEGAGVADVLFGDVKFTGTLSHSWPRDSTELPLVDDQSPYDPLFAYGFGLH